MAVILEQNSVDDLIKLKERIDLANNTKEKVKYMYKEICGFDCLEELGTLASIGVAISDMNRVIQNENIYYQDFMRLKNSYQKKILGVN